MPIRHFLYLLIIALAAAPSQGFAQTIIDAPPTVIGPSFDLNDGQTLNLGPGGVVGDFFDALAGSTVNITGGVLGDLADAGRDSEINISGGTIGEGFDALSGSIVNLSGGTVRGGFRTFSESTVTITGGSLGRGIETSTIDSTVELIGDDFRLDGAPFSGSSVSLSGSEVFTGTLADGSTFAFSPLSFDVFLNVTLTPSGTPLLDLSPKFVSDPVISGPSGLRAGQTLTLQDGGVLRDNFAVIGATLNVKGGMLGENADIVGGVVNLSGGTIGDYLFVFPGSEVNISGGGIGEAFRVHAGSQVNLFGAEFLLDGVPIAVPQTGGPVAITDRDGSVLSGTLADGSPFSFELNNSFFDGDFFDPNATITVTLVPEPTTFALFFAAACAIGLRGRYRVRLGAEPKA